MRTAILGWGSLLWETREDFDSCHGPWQHDGPTLPIEFSRISSTRLGALTLVIDSRFGSPTTVAWCMSKRNQLEDAISDLAQREGTSLANVGKCVGVEPHASGTDPVRKSIHVWSQNKNEVFDAVLWTALTSNFLEKYGSEFSVDTATRYLQALPPAGKARAAEYVWRTPRFVSTPLRMALESEPWFSGPVV